MTVEVNLPDNLELTPQDVVTALAAQLYGAGKLSLGQAASVAGKPKSEFMELLATYGVSVFNFPVNEIESDLQNARVNNR